MFTFRILSPVTSIASHCFTACLLITAPHWKCDASLALCSRTVVSSLSQPCSDQLIALLAPWAWLHAAIAFIGSKTGLMAELFLDSASKRGARTVIKSVDAKLVCLLKQLSVIAHVWFCGRLVLRAAGALARVRQHGKLTTPPYRGWYQLEALHPL